MKRASFLCSLSAAAVLLACTSSEQPAGDDAATSSMTTPTPSLSGSMPAGTGPGVSPSTPSPPTVPENSGPQNTAPQSTSSAPQGSGGTPSTPSGAAGNSDAMPSEEPAMPSATGTTPDATSTPSSGEGGVGSTPPLASGGGGAAGATAGGSGGNDAEPAGTVLETLVVADVFSGHPVPFALATFQDRQFVAYYDAQQRMTIAARTLGESTFTYQVLPTSIGWDSHNYIAMAVDELGHIHVSGNMHNVPLIYFRTTTPLDISTLEAVPQMVGSNEQSVTYPEFFVGPSGDLTFIYRDGGSGSGDHIFNSYDAAARDWTRLLDTPLTFGESLRNAYPVGPIQGPDGQWHLVWVWRDTPDASTNHDLSYARTSDLVSWQRGDGQALTLPITLGSSDIVDPVPVQGGMINNNTKVGFDAENRPVIVYHKYDANGFTQLYNARLEDGEWVVHQTSEWDYRWDFGGGGTLVFEIEVEGIEVQPDGSLTQRFYHAQYGGLGAFRLNPTTLAAEATIDPPRPYPAELDTPESATPDMVVRWQKDWGPSSDTNVQYLLRWETLPSNRDMARDPVPPPTELRLYAVAR